jgi:hypothetical protein
MLVSNRTGGLAILNEDWVVNGEMLRTVSCLESCCKHCDERMVIECDTNDIPIGI